MGRADLHIHTIYSADGTATVPAVLEYASRQAGLDVIAITDHDEIEGALEALDLAAAFGIHVVPGIEVTTREGDLLVLWVTQKVPRGLSILETIQFASSLGGLCIAPHPGLRWSWCASRTVLESALRQPGIGEVLVGAEHYNASLPRLSANRTSAALGRHLGLSEVANSDAHILPVIGCGATEFPGDTPTDLRQALLERATRLVIRPRPRHFMALWTKRRLLRALGYVHSPSADPGCAVALRSFHTTPAVYAPD